MTNAALSDQTPSLPSAGWYLFDQPVGQPARFWVEPFDRGEPTPWFGLHRSPETRHDPKQSIAYLSSDMFAAMAPAPAAAS